MNNVKSTSRKLLAVVISCSLFATFVTASELSDRVDKLEERNLKLEQKNKTLEKKINKIGKRSKKRSASLKRMMANRDERTRFNGFLSAYATKNNKDTDFAYEGLKISENWSFSPDSIVGMQWDYKATEKVSATIQLVAKGSKDFDVEAEWMYFTYQISEGMKVQAGRLRNPLYLKSDIYEVGFSYAWVRPSVDVYIPDVTSYEGVALHYTTQVLDWHTRYILSYGSIDEDLTSIRDRWAYVAEASKNEWTARVAYHSVGKFIVNVFPDDKPESSDYYVASVGYDDGSLEVIAEVTDLVVSDDASLMGHTSGFLSLAYRIGKFQPYLVFGAIDSRASADHRADKSQSIAFVNDLVPEEVHQKSYSLGLRYELSSKAALKIDATYLNDFEGTGGRMNIYNPAPNVTTNQAKLDKLGDSATTLAIGVDMIF